MTKLKFKPRLQSVKDCKQKEHSHPWQALTAAFSDLMVHEQKNSRSKTVFKNAPKQTLTFPRPKFSCLINIQRKREYQGLKFSHKLH